MKKIIYGLLLLVTFTMIACKDELPQASWDLCEIGNLTAQPQDEAVVLSWDVPSQGTPTGYYVSWTPSSSGVSGGNITLEKETAVTVTGLMNKESYTFSVQAIYGNKRSGRVSVKATPISSKLPPVDLIAIAGDGKVKLTWSKPDAENLQGYKLIVSPDDRAIEIDDTNVELYIIQGLENGREYTVSLQAVYKGGESEAVTAKVTPGAVKPVIGLKNYILAGEPLELSYNDMYFMGDVRSVLWTFGDGTQDSGERVEKTYTAGGAYLLKVEVTNADGQKETAETDVFVIASSWKSITGYVKTSNAVFSHDGKTFYLPTANKVGDLNAFEAITGTKKWTFAISSITYGGGAAVGPDDVIYQAARDAKLYAVTSDGVQKWVYETGAKNKNLDCFPAITADGSRVYILDGDNVLHAVNTSNATAIWTKRLEGTDNKAGAIAIDKNGKIYVGTRSFIYAFNASGEQLWQTAASVTEIGSFALDGGTLYAAQIGGGGLIAVSTADGQVKWSVTSSGDAYAPVVGKDGSVYFVDKGGKSLYAVSAEGVLKWKFNGGSALTYCFPVLDEKGIIYFGTSGGTIFAIDSATGTEAWKMETDATGDNAKIMSGMTVGPDKKLYVSYIGGNMTAIPVFAGPETSTWSCRGGNIYGTNQY